MVCKIVFCSEFAPDIPEKCGRKEGDRERQ